MNRALLTGGTGFVGSHLAKALCERGWIVDVIVRETSNPGRLMAMAPCAEIHVTRGGAARVAEIVGSTRPDVIFHLAAEFKAQHELNDVDRLVRNNVGFGCQIAEAMAESGVRRLVNTGTSWQHLNNAAYDPVCLYAAMKQAFEAILRYYVESGHFRVVTLKLFDTYGPGDHRGKLLSTLTSGASDARPLALSAGHQQMDLVHVDNVVRAFINAAENFAALSRSGMSAYAISSGAEISLRDLIALYSRVTGRTVAADWGARPYRPREPMVPWSAGEPLPGWAPEVSLEEGLAFLANQTDER